MNVTSGTNDDDDGRSRDEAHLQSASVVAKMKRAVSNPQLSFIGVATISLTCVQLVGLSDAIIHIHRDLHTYIWDRIGR